VSASFYRVRLRKRLGFLPTDLPTLAYIARALSILDVNQSTLAAAGDAWQGRLMALAESIGL
jgi:hypothetical protein